jgi:hypothetical protein
VPEIVVPRDRILIASGNFMRLGSTNAPEAHKLPARGFSDQIFENSKML